MFEASELIRSRGTRLDLPRGGWRLHCPLALACSSRRSDVVAEVLREWRVARTGGTLRLRSKPDLRAEPPHSPGDSARCHRQIQRTLACLNQLRTPPNSYERRRVSTKAPTPRP